MAPRRSRAQGRQLAGTASLTGAHARGPPRRRSIPPTRSSSRAAGAPLAALAILLLALMGLAWASSASAAPARGLVAAYGFNEANSKGMRFGDGSGHKNGAKGSHVRRVRGKFGRGAGFNGKSSWLTVRSRKSLNMRGALTLEAWVQPRAASGSRSILMKQGRGKSQYALYAASPRAGIAAEASVGGKSYPVGGGQTLRLGRWTHLAATYDRAHLNLYRNGVEVASVPASGRLGSSRGPLRIGGNSIAGEWFKGVIDDVRIYNRALTPAEIQRDMRRSVGRPARSAAPAPAPAPSGPGPFSFGIVTTRGIEHIDDARKLGARITRIHFDIHTPVADMREFVGRAASEGVEVILLAAFEDGGIPSADEARGLGAWAREFGPGGTFWQGRSDGAYASRYIEFGNETSYSYQGTQNEGGQYALRARDAIEAIRAANPRVGLLVQADDANINPSPWVRDMFNAVPNLGNLAAGWTVHPYGPRSRWEPKISNLINQTAAAGSPPLPIFATEYGISTDNGRTLSDNYEWPTNMTYQQAADAILRDVPAMNARYPGRIAVLLWYFIRDHAAPGASSDREDYFGAIKEDRSDKGPLTGAMRQLLARFPGH